MGLFQHASRLMNAARRRPACLAIVLASLVAAGAVDAQTPGQMEYERQQREYWRAQEQQRQEQQRQQQVQNENARRQQQESADAVRRSQERASTFNEGPGQSTDSARGQQAQGQGQGQAQAQGAQLEAARQSWLKRPALAAERNPLLGRWMRPASSRTNSSDPFAALGALARGGLCELMFGGGVFEFRPGTLVGMDGRTREQELDQVQYRGDARQVVVIPKQSFKLMIFEFDGPDRITWQGQNCQLVRVTAAAQAGGPATARAAATPPPSTGAAPATAALPGSAAVLSMVAGVGHGDTFSPLAGHKFIVMRQSANVALTRAGFRPPPGMSTLTAWVSECQRRTPACRQGAEGLKADSLGYLQTDAQGKAQTPPLTAGVYYLFGSSRQPAGEVFWNLRVDLKQGRNTVLLDQRNTSPMN